MVPPSAGSFARESPRSLQPATASAVEYMDQEAALRAAYKGDNDLARHYREVESELELFRLGGRDSGG